MTDKEIEALEFPSLKAKTAQENGAKSRGPKTAEGKAKSCRNALKHGFRSKKTVVLDPNDEEDYNQYRESMIASLRPTDANQATFAELVIVNGWRLKKAIEFQTDVLIEYSNEDQHEFEAYFNYPAASRYKIFREFELKFESSLHKALKALLALKKADAAIQTKTGTNEPNAVARSAKEEPKPAIPFFSGLPEQEPEPEDEVSNKRTQEEQATPNSDERTQEPEDAVKSEETLQRPNSDKRTQDQVQPEPKKANQTNEPKLKNSQLAKDQNPPQHKRTQEPTTHDPKNDKQTQELNEEPTPKPESSRSQYGFKRTEEEYREARRRLDEQRSRGYK